MGTVYLGKANPMGSGGGGSIEVDQTYDATSANAQSGTAVAEAIATVPTYSAGTNVTITNGTISATDTTYSAFTGATSQAAGAAGLVPAPATTDVDKYLKGDGTWGTVSSGGGIQNTATGTGSLTIIGMPSSEDYSINLGYSSGINGAGGVAIGYSTAASEGAVAIGYGDDGTYAGNGTIAIGLNAHTYGTSNVVIGTFASAGDNTTESIALGIDARAESDRTFYVGFGYDSDTSSERNYLLLDGSTGKIPNDRINGVSGSFTTNDGKNVTVTNGVITSIV